MWGTLRRPTLCDCDGHGFCNDLLRAVNSLMHCEMTQPVAVVRAQWAHANTEMDEKTQLMSTLATLYLTNYPKLHSLLGLPPAELVPSYPNLIHCWARLLRNFYPVTQTPVTAGPAFCGDGYPAK